MDTTIPRVSLGLPVFNGERFLEETLESLLAQTYQDFELIISDNASQDRTQRICTAYAAKDKRIRYFRSEKNWGSARNHNHLFELSSGEYFKWAASDDLCAPEFLERCVEILDNQPEFVLCYAKTKIIDEHGRIFKDYDDHLNLRSPLVRERFPQLVQTICECNAVFGLIRTNVLRKTKLIQPYISSDVWLLAELSLHGPFWEMPEFLFFRRDHPTASSRNKGWVQQMEFFDPARKDKIVLPLWRRFFEHLVSIKRVSLKLSEKVYLARGVFLWAIWGRRLFLAQLLIVIKQIVRRFNEKPTAFWLLANPFSSKSVKTVSIEKQ